MCYYKHNKCCLFNNVHTVTIAQYTSWSYLGMCTLDILRLLIIIIMILHKLQYKNGIDKMEGVNFLGTLHKLQCSSYGFFSGNLI